MLSSRGFGEGGLVALLAWLQVIVELAGRIDDQVQAIAIEQLALLVGRLGVLDFLDPEHLGVFSVGAFLYPPKIPPVKL